MQPPSSVKRSLACSTCPPSRTRWQLTCSPPPHRGKGRLPAAGHSPHLLWPVEFEAALSTPLPRHKASQRAGRAPLQKQQQRQASSCCTASMKQTAPLRPPALEPWLAEDGSCGQGPGPTQSGSWAHDALTSTPDLALISLQPRSACTSLANSALYSHWCPVCHISQSSAQSSRDIS